MLAMSDDAFFREGRRFTLLSQHETVRLVGCGLSIYLLVFELMLPIYGSSGVKFPYKLACY